MKNRCSEASRVGETLGKGVAAALNAAVRVAVIAACGRYLGWW
jgi:hypothetical protein